MGTYRNPEEMSGKVLDLIRKYNVMELGQVELFFPGERTGVIRAMRRLEKNRQIFRNPYTGLVSSSGFAYSVKDEGTIRALWVLGDMVGKRKIEGHFLAQREDFPVRIVFFDSGEIYDILYVGIGDVKLVNGIYGKMRRPEGRHIVVIEDKELMGQIKIPDVVGFCLVRDSGEVEYYRKREKNGGPRTGRRPAEGGPEAGGDYAGTSGGGWRN